MFSLISFTAAFAWSALLVAASAASTNVSVSKKSTQLPGQGTVVVPADEKCRTVVNGNYYAGTNKEIKAILQGIQAQLSEMQEQLRKIQTVNGNKTGERENPSVFRVIKLHPINEHCSTRGLAFRISDFLRFKNF